MKDDAAIFLAQMTEPEVAELLAGSQRSVLLQPVGSIEPHGPHLALSTDNVISEAAAFRALPGLAALGVACRIAPTIPYGVTECARQFAGAVSVPDEALRAFLHSVASAYLQGGFDQVCLINNHLEPGQDRAVRAAAQGFLTGQVVVACPLSRQWARTLSQEFKSGACHAGSYETSIVMASRPELVDDEIRQTLPPVPVSLSEKLASGVDDFVEMGMDRAYAGQPAQASVEHGTEQLERLAEMIVGEIAAGLTAAGLLDQGGLS